MEPGDEDIELVTRDAWTTGHIDDHYLMLKIYPMPSVQPLQSIPQPICGNFHLRPFKRAVYRCILDRNGFDVDFLGYGDSNYAKMFNISWTFAAGN